jgi:hypothetical protein
VHAPEFIKTLAAELGITPPKIRLWSRAFNRGPRTKSYDLAIIEEELPLQNEQLKLRAVELGALSGTPARRGTAGRI